MKPLYNKDALNISLISRTINQILIVLALMFKWMTIITTIVIEDWVAAPSKKSQLTETLQEVNDAIAREV